MSGSEADPKKLDRLEAQLAELPDMSGIKKATIALLVLGEDLARDIFKQLTEDEIEKVLLTAESLRDVSAEEVQATLMELTHLTQAQVKGVAGHERRIQADAEAALGRDNLTAILGRDTGGTAAMLESAALKDPVVFAQVVGREHPQVIAVVLAMLSKETGAAVLTELSQELKAEVVQRVALLRSVPAHVVAEVAEIMGRELRPPDEAGPVQIDGMSRAVGILKAIGSSEEQDIFAEIEQEDAELAEDIRSRMFVFDDILQLHARAVQLILREVDGQTLALALKTASSGLKEHILSNMSSRAAMMVLDDLEVLGPVSVAQVEEAQRQVVETVMQLAAEDKINIRQDDVA